ncbi:MAG: MMPL family transporter [Rhodospirillaceae bacterium]
MVIALFANMTLLPALIALAPLTARLRGGRPSALGERLNPAPWLARHAGAVCVAALALTLGAAALLPRVAFDFDPLNLKDPTTESVATLHDLMRDGRRSHHTTDVLAPSLAAADALAARLTALDLVDSARTLSSYVPADQDEKLQVIADLALLIGPALSGGGRPVRLAPSGRAAAWTALKPKLDALGRAGNNGQATAARRMIAAVDGLAGGGATRLLELENRLLTGLPGRLTALSQSLRAGPVALDGLPAALRDRNVAADGRALIEVAPSEPLADRDAIRRFVTEVRTVAPDAVGSPVVILEAGRTVLGAFAQACLTAVVGIVALLWLVLGRAWDVGLVFVPLALAGLWTLGAAAAFGVAFNLANVIVLPLLFGLGVAGGIHLVSRARASGEIGEAMRTSTPRAVLFSALTTIGSFGSISLSAHPGTASMGVLLTLALAMTLLSTLVFLPALLAWLGERRADGDG